MSEAIFVERDRECFHRGAYPDLLEVSQWRAACAEFGLTRREVEVLRGLCRGQPNEKICEELKMGMATLRTHLRSIYTKLRVVDRVDVILLLVHRYLKRPGEGPSA